MTPPHRASSAAYTKSLETGGYYKGLVLTYANGASTMNQPWLCASCPFARTQTEAVRAAESDRSLVIREPRKEATVSLKNFYLVESSMASLILLAKVDHVTNLVLMNSKK